MRTDLRTIRGAVRAAVVVATLGTAAGCTDWAVPGAADRPDAQFIADARNGRLIVTGRAPHLEAIAAQHQLERAPERGQKRIHRPELEEMYGFDTASSLGEETNEPRKTAPKAILRAILASFVIGFALAAALAALVVQLVRGLYETDRGGTFVSGAVVSPLGVGSTPPPG